MRVDALLTFLDYSPRTYDLTGRVRQKHRSDQLNSLCKVSWLANKPSEKEVKVLARTYHITDFYANCDLLTNYGCIDGKVILYVWLDCNMKECYIRKDGFIGKERQPLLEVDRYIKQFYNCQITIDDYLKGLLI